MCCLKIPGQVMFTQFVDDQHVKTVDEGDPETRHVLNDDVVYERGLVSQPLHIQESVYELDVGFYQVYKGLGLAEITAGVDKRKNRPIRDTMLQHRLKNFSPEESLMFCHIMSCTAMKPFAAMIDLLCLEAMATYMLGGCPCCFLISVRFPLK